MTIQKVPRFSPLSEQVCLLIEEQIINGAYRVGDKLPTEKQLGESFKVSRTVIREAIKGLKEKGWIETHVAKGSYVTYNMSKSVQSSFDAAVRMEPDEGFDKLLQLRSMLEPEIAALAASYASENDLAELRNAVAQMAKALREHAEVEEFRMWDSVFHRKLAESTNNNFILMIINPVIEVMRDFQIYHYTKVRNGPQRSNKNHKKILEAIEMRDAAAARKAMVEHIHQLDNDIRNRERAHQHEGNGFEILRR